MNPVIKSLLGRAWTSYEESIAFRVRNDELGQRSSLNLASLFAQKAVALFEEQIEQVDTPTSQNMGCKCRTELSDCPWKVVPVGMEEAGDVPPSPASFY